MDTPVDFTSSGVVLGRQPLRESDLILTVLTEQRGKISALARGAVRSKKRFMGGVDLFDCGTFDLQSNKKHDHLYVLHARSGGNLWKGLRGSLLKFTLGSFCLEMANTFSPEGEPDSALLYLPLIDALKAIDTATSHFDAYVAAFNFGFETIRQSGYNPTKSPALADASEIYDSFFFLVHYTEQILEQPLRSHDALFAELTKLRK